MKKRRLYAVINIVALSALALLVVWDYMRGGIMYSIIKEDSDSVRTYFESFSNFTRIVAVLLVVYIAVVIGVIPGLLVYPIIGILMNPLLGALLIVIANTLGSVTNYFQGRILSKGLADVEKDEKRFVNKLRDGGSWTLFLLRLNPLTSFDFLPYIAGGTGMKFWPFFWANTIGLLPIIFMGTFVGEKLFDEYSWILQILVVLTIMYAMWSVYKSKKKAGWSLFPGRR